MRTSINKWNHFDQKSCWKSLSQQQQTSRLQCEELRTHEQRRQKSNNTIFFYIYRRHIYCFVIINKMKIIDQMMNEIDTIEQILNSILNLFVHRLVVEQEIYDLSTLTNDFFILSQRRMSSIDRKNEFSSIFIEVWLKRSVFLNMWMIWSVVLMNMNVEYWSIFDVFVTSSTRTELWKSFINELAMKKVLKSYIMIELNIRCFCESVNENNHVKFFFNCVLNFSTNDIDVFVLIENKIDINRVLNCRHD